MSETNNTPNNEGNNTGDTNTGNVGGSQGNTSPEGKIFSEDYVKTIREEAKAHRINSKNYEAKLKEVLGLSPDADLTKVDDLIKGHKEGTQKQIAEALTKANDTLVKAELKSLGTDYDIKLVERLLDKGKVTVENGEVKGLKEALIELEKEFPTIKKTPQQQTPTGTNPAGAGTGSVDLSKLSMEEYLVNFNKRK